MALSFKKLKTILECRGLGYSGLPEKKDVRELVEKSGEYRLPEGPLHSEEGTTRTSSYLVVPQNEAVPGRVKQTTSRAARVSFVQVFYQKNSKSQFLEGAWAGIICRGVGVSS